MDAKNPGVPKNPASGCIQVLPFMQVSCTERSDLFVWVMSAHLPPAGSFLTDPLPLPLSSLPSLQYCLQVRCQTVVVVGGLVNFISSALQGSRSLKCWALPPLLRRSATRKLAESALSAQGAVPSTQTACAASIARGEPAWGSMALHGLAAFPNAEVPTASCPPRPFACSLFGISCKKCHAAACLEHDTTYKSG